MSSKPKPKRPNAVRRIMEREESRERRFREASVASNGGASNTTPTAAPPKPNRPKCANPKCPKPNVVDGTCQTCGMVADDSNIVSEITFGESSSGAAVVHGTHVAFDQGGIRGVGGLAFRRVAGGGASEARERSLREVKALMQQYSYQLRIGQSISDIAFRYYKACSHANFVQGRRKQNVAAICLYAACRAENNHKIMLIDLADLLRADVFALGRGYKDFLNRFPEFLTGPRPIVIEDLIYRFASKLEFLHDTNKVALSAVRIAKRMQHDNITHGRRPAGICGAALIMAARAHNYRRTVREVVYIVKVTMATIQERMDEFASVPAAQMTVQDFHDKDPLEAGPAHDPPFVYKQTDEWKAKHTRPKKRKRKDAGDGKKRGGKKIRTNNGSSAAPQTIDKDGFVVPPVPRQEGDSDPDVEAEALIVTAVAGEEQQLKTLVEEYGELDEEDEDEDDDSDSDLDSGDEEDDVDPSSEVAFAKAQGVDIAASGASTSNGETAGKKGDKKKKKGGKKLRKITMPITQEWQTDEALLEKEMEGHLHDPEFLNAAQAEKVATDKRVETEKKKKLADARKKKLELAQKAKQQAANSASASTAPAPASAPASTSGPTVNPTPAPTSTEQPNTTKETDTVMEDAGAREERQDEPVTDRLNPSFPIQYTRPQYIPNKALDDPIVHEHEFADDPEVKYCRLGEAEAKMKEQIWVNIHVDFLRSKQQKVFDAKLAEKNKGPNSKKRKNKKNRVEDNGGVPETAEEAAVNMMRNRGISTKLDYSKLGQIFDLDFNEKGPGSNEADSALASEAGDATEGHSNEGESSGGAAAATVGTTTGAGGKTHEDAVEEEAEEEEVEEAPEEAYEEYNENEGGYDDYDEGGEEDINPFADDDEVDDDEEY
ncbi:transcription factor TFIIIB subunit brf1 [Neurospora sp. IMI 360204]|nr:transcription factor TFIIIB subunit brf1 [Neurospora sp. IMI 360204]